MEQENFAPYPGNLNEDPVMHLVKSIKHDYQTETNNVLPLAESFSNPVRHENFNLFKKIGKAAKSVGKGVSKAAKGAVKDVGKLAKGNIKGVIKDVGKAAKGAVKDVGKATKSVGKTLTNNKSKNKKKSSKKTALNDASNDIKDSSELIDDLKNEKTALEQQLTALQDNINNNMSQIDQTDQLISEKKVRNLQQKREILNKLNVVETRNRMLQLSQEKNIYKTKVINTMIAVILGGLTVSALLYVRNKK